MFAVASSRVITPTKERPAAVLIDNEKIVDVVSVDNVPSDIELTDFGDLIIAPGVVDAHVHINEPGRSDWEGFTAATRAAVAGGITTLVDMPLNSNPVTTTVDALNAKQYAAVGKCHSDIGFYGGLVPDNSSQIGSLLDHGVLGIKTFLCDSGLEDFPASTLQDIELAASDLKEKTAVLLAHAELTNAIITPGVSNVASYAQYAASRPAEFEIAAIELLIEFCRKYQTRVHIVHLATARALPLLEVAKDEGLPLTVETCPHYLYFSMDDIRDGDTKFKCAPPIRDETNRTQLCEAVERGLIDTIGSDHSPCPPSMKLLDEGNYSKAWGGIAGLQLTLSLCWTIGKDRGWTPLTLSKLLAQSPAEIFGLGKRKGQIAKGYDADLVVWNPDAKFACSGSKLFHKHPITPYDGRKFWGVVKATFLRGKVAYENGHVDSEPRGSILRRDQLVSTEIADFLNHILNQDNSENEILSTRFQTLEKCCASREWIAKMCEGPKFCDDADLMHRAEQAWKGLAEADYLEAFAAHPRIGDVDTLKEKYANTKRIAENEQAGIRDADDQVLIRLAKLNEQYLKKFGFIFIICATGKSASEMLDAIEARITNNRDQEIANAAAEQMKITRIRIRKLIA